MLAIGLFAALAASAEVHAGESAKAHFNRATAQFALGNFSQAATEYEAAYQLKQDPALLFDAAQAHRLAGHHQKALILYRNYVQLYPKEQNIDEVREQIEKLKTAIQADETAKTAPPVGAVAPSKPLPEAAPAERPSHAEAESRPPSTQPAGAQKPEKQPVYKKWWLWTLVGAVAAAGIVTAVVLSVDRTPWANVKDIGPSAQALLVGVRF